MSYCKFLGKAVLGLGVASGIFLSSLSGATAQKISRSPNERAVGVISGGIDGTYARFGSDLAAVLNGYEGLRVVPMLGLGSLQNLFDLLYLRGVDVCILQSDVGAYAKREKLFPGFDSKIRYVTKLYNEEFHLLAGPDVKTVADLKGKKVNFDVVGSGTEMTASLILDALDVDVEKTSFDQASALEKLKTGEISALAYVSGKPTRLFRDTPSGGGIHFLSIPATPEIMQTYLPSHLDSSDYPSLVPEGEKVQTVAVGAVMAVYNWPKGTERHNKVVRFTDALFSRFAEFMKPPRHAKWHEVNLASPVPGWTRIEAAQRWEALSSR